MYNFSFICRASKIDKKGFALLHYHSVIYLYHAYSARAGGFSCHRFKVDSSKIFRYSHSFCRLCGCKDTHL